MNNYLITMMVITVFILGMSIGYNITKKENTEITTNWKNFVITGHNVSIYVDTKEFSNFDGSFSFWIETVGEIKDTNLGAND